MANVTNNLWSLADQLIDPDPLESDDLWPLGSDVRLSETFGTNIYGQITRINRETTPPTYSVTTSEGYMLTYVPEAHLSEA